MAKKEEMVFFNKHKILSEYKILSFPFSVHVLIFRPKLRLSIFLSIYLAINPLIPIYIYTYIFQYSIKSYISIYDIYYIYLPQKYAAKVLDCQLFLG